MIFKIWIRALYAALLGLCTFAASALVIDDYSPAAIKKAEAAGQSYVLAFHADWCPTCRAQAKVFEQLKTDPALKTVTLFNVDYDGETDLKKQLKVRGQSTLIVYKGAKEVSRSVGETSADALKKRLAQSL